MAVDQNLKKITPLEDKNDLTEKSGFAEKSENRSDWMIVVERIGDLYLKQVFSASKWQKHTDWFLGAALVVARQSESSVLDIQHILAVPTYFNEVFPKSPLFGPVLGAEEHEYFSQFPPSIAETAIREQVIDRLETIAESDFSAFFSENFADIEPVLAIAHAVRTFESTIQFYNESLFLHSVLLSVFQERGWFDDEVTPESATRELAFTATERLFGDPEGVVSTDPSEETQTDPISEVLGAAPAVLTDEQPERERDLLYRMPLATRVAHLLNEVWFTRNLRKHDVRYKEKREPEEAAFVLHVDAPWGGGKTTFANFIELQLGNIFRRARRAEKDRAEEQGAAAKLKLQIKDILRTASVMDPEGARPGPSWSVIWFNAWQNQHVDPPWWNLYEHILSGLRREQRWWLPARYLNWCGEGLWRMRTPLVLREFIVLLFFSLLLVIVLLAINLTALGAALSDQLAALFSGQDGDGNQTGLSQADAKFILSVLAATLGGGALLKFFGTLRNASGHFVDLVSGRGQVAALGEADPFRRLRDHFRRVMSRRGRPVLVVLDDMDRCRPEYVVDLIRGILTVFRSNHVFFLILGDRNWIEGCFDKVHEAMKPTHRDEAVSFGARFTQKAIQLSVLLPIPDETTRKAYLAEVLRGARGGSYTLQAALKDATTGDLESTAKKPQRAKRSLAGRLDVSQSVRRSVCVSSGNCLG